MMGNGRGCGMSIDVELVKAQGMKRIRMRAMVRIRMRVMVKAAVQILMYWIVKAQRIMGMVEMTAAILR